MIPSKEKIEEIIKELQKIMRLQDWDIEIRYLNGLDFVNKHDTDAVMIASINETINRAFIDVSYERKDISKDWYHGIVHELFHILLNRYEEWKGPILGFLNESTADAYKERYRIIDESITDKLAGVFETVYPVTNFIKEGEM